MKIEKTISIEQWREDVANVYLEAIRLKCESLYDHSIMTARAMVYIAHSFSFKKEKICLLKSAAMLHDAGKISIRTEILKKPGELSVQEWEQMKTHPVAGADSLSKIVGLERVRAIIEGHHENDDSSGYPYALPGHMISFETKLLRAADIFSAMIMQRSYKPALPSKIVLEEIEKKSQSLEPGEQSILLSSLFNFAKEFKQ